MRLCRQAKRSSDRSVFSCLGRVPNGSSRQWNSREHLFAVAGEALRRILVQRARRKSSLKAGGVRHRLELSDIEPAVAEPNFDLLALGEVLKRLEQHNKRMAELVKLRFFAGLTIAQAAQVLGISTSTADNDRAYARAYARCWLRLENGADVTARPDQSQKESEFVRGIRGPFRTGIWGRARLPPACARAVPKPQGSEQLPIGFPSLSKHPKRCRATTLQKTKDGAERAAAKKFSFCVK
jgi:hypothetical protein